MVVSLERLFTEISSELNPFTTLMTLLSISDNTSAVFVLIESTELFTSDVKSFFTKSTISLFAPSIFKVVSDNCSFKPEMFFFNESIITAISFLNSFFKSIDCCSDF